MARRQSSENFPDPFDGEFEDPDVQLDSSRLDDPLVEDIDYDDLTEPVGLGGSVTREPLSAGQIIGGALQVIVQTVIVLVVFLAIGFGVVFAGQRIGVFPQRAASVAAPNLGIAVGIVPTQAPTAIPSTAIPPTATLAPGEMLDCPGAVTWWSSQQVQDNYTYFTTTALNEARGSNRIPALMENMRIRRNFVANTPMDACAEEIRAALLRAFDATIEAARSVGAADEAALATQLDNVNAAYADLQEALALVGVTVEIAPVS